MCSEEAIRIDKYLWAVRIYKTRSIATEACRSGRVKMGAQVLKPSHEVKVGEIYSLSIDQLHRMVEVKALLGKRVGAQLVQNYLIDRTPQEEYERIQMVRQFGFESRGRGLGRPTKRDRRSIDEFKDNSR